MPKRGTNIYKRKDGRWEARYPVPSHAGGRKKYRSVYGRTYREAREKQLQHMQQAAQPAPKAPALLLSQLMQCWLKSAAPSLKRSSYLKYESLIRNHLTGGIGQLPASQITGQQVDDWKNSLLQRDPPLSPKTVNDILTLMKQAYAYADQEFSIPAPSLRRIREPAKDLRVLSLREQQRLEEFLLRDTDLYKLGILLALYTGLRVGELCALQWEDLREGSLSVTKTLHRIRQKDRTEVVLSTPKTKSSLRQIPVPPFLLPRLEQFRDTGFLIKTAWGTPAEPRLMQMKFRKYLDQCGMEAANFHALRHTFATRCVEAGFDIKSLSEIMGHADVKTTLNRYVHASYDLKIRNMEKLSPLSSGWETRQESGQGPPLP